MNNRAIEKQILDHWESLQLEPLRYLLDVLIAVKRNREPNLPEDERAALRAFLGDVRTTTRHLLENSTR